MDNNDPEKQVKNHKCVILTQKRCQVPFYFKFRLVKAQKTPKINENKVIKRQISRHFVEIFDFFLYFSKLAQKLLYYK